MELSGARVLVTGASTGIGAALARTLARQGATVALVARRAALLDEVVAECHAAGSMDSVRYAIDLADLDAAESLATRVWDDLGGLDVLINNAGIPKRKHVLRLTPQEVEQTMRLNYLSPVRMTLALLPRMVERGSGAIVMVASMAGRIGTPREAAYSGSKFALTGFTESLRIDLTGSPIQVRLVHPGPIETPIWDAPDNEAASYNGDFYPPEDVADAVVAALHGDRFETYVPPSFADLVTVKTADIDGFLDGAAAFDRSGL